MNDEQREALHDKYQDDLKRKRAQANAALPDLLDKYPEADQIAPRAYSDPRKDAYENWRLGLAKQELHRDTMRYNDLRTKGADVIDEWMLMTLNQSPVYVLQYEIEKFSKEIALDKGMIAFIEGKQAMFPDDFK